MPQRENLIESLSLAQARKLAIRAQRFAPLQKRFDAGSKTTWRSVRPVLDGMQALQIDAINTVIRSHYMPLFSRLGAYDRSLLDRQLFDEKSQRPGKRNYFEYWGHECSVMPLELYPLFDWRRDDARRGIGVYKQAYESAKERSGLVGKILSRVSNHGPLTCSELEPDKRGPGMWEWSQTKQALEYLFWTGDLASAGRRRFQRIYGAADSVIPTHLLGQTRHRLDDQMTLLELSAGALGVATESDLRDYFRLKANDGKLALTALVEDQRLLPVKVEGWQQQGYTLPNPSIPRKIDTATLLTPFDPIVWHRDRALRLYDFHYRIEIYVPQAKRQYGYWVMPFLYKDSLPARVDLKACRETSSLLVKGAWLEPAADQSEVAPALANALRDLAQWLDLEHIVVSARNAFAKQLIIDHEAV